MWPFTHNPLAKRASTEAGARILASMNVGKTHNPQAGTRPIPQYPDAMRSLKVINRF